MNLSIQNNFLDKCKASYHIKKKYSLINRNRFRQIYLYQDIVH